MGFLVGTMIVSVLAGIGIGLEVRIYKNRLSSFAESIALSVMGGFLGSFLSLPVSFLLNDIYSTIPMPANILQLLAAIMFACIFSFVLNWKYQGKL